jgi:hypothetical protein
MSNVRVQAAAEGMPTLNRRTALSMTGAGIVSAITVLSSSARAAPLADAAPHPVRHRSGMSPELRAVINEHKNAWADWQSVCSCTDTAILGREATAEERQTW